MNILKRLESLPKTSFTKGLYSLFLCSLVLLSLFFVYRTFFIIYFSPAGLELPWWELVKTYLWGIKFDAIVISYAFLPLYLLYVGLAFFRSEFFTKILRRLSVTYTIFIALIILVLLVSDLGFYSFYQMPINAIFFGLIEDDTKAIFISIWKNYPVILLLLPVALLIYTLYKAMHYCFRSYRGPHQQTKPLTFLLQVFISVIFITVAIRGGFGKLPLAPKYSSFSHIEFLNQRAVNGIIHFDIALRLRLKRTQAGFDMIKDLGFKNKKDATEVYLGSAISSAVPKIEDLLKTTPKRPSVEKKPLHVIVILMESFGKSWLKYHGKGFNILGDLEPILDNSISFERFISSDGGTIGSTLAVGTNLTIRPGKLHYSESKKAARLIKSGAHLPYKNLGYHTEYVYGGKLSWRNLGSFFTKQQYDRVTGQSQILEAMKLPTEAGTEWGIFDEYLFDYIFKNIEKSAGPQFIMALTTTNHPPFELPKDYQPQEDIKIPEGLKARVTREEDLFITRFQAYRYANDQLAKFIRKIKRHPLLSKNTLIAVTGDHNFLGFMTFYKSEEFVKKEVPFFMILPDRPGYEEIAFDAYNPGTHIDLMPTVYDLTLSEQKYLSVGRSLLKPNPWSLWSGGYFNSKMFYLDGTFSVWAGDNNNHLKDTEESDNELLRKAKSSIAVSEIILDF